MCPLLIVMPHVNENVCNGDVLCGALPRSKAIVESMMEVFEELEHFAQVMALVHARDLKLGADIKDPYVNALLKLVAASKKTVGSTALVWNYRGAWLRAFSNDRQCRGRP